MESKPLRRKIILALDTIGIDGPVTVRMIAEKVLDDSTDDDWSFNDTREAKLRYLMDDTKGYMLSPCPDHMVEHIIPNVPKKYRAIMSRLPRYICRSPQGGRNSEWVFTLNATRDDWQANTELKGYIAEKTALSRDESRDVKMLLEHKGVGCLADLFKRELERAD